MLMIDNHVQYIVSNVVTGGGANTINRTMQAGGKWYF